MVWPQLGPHLVCRCGPEWANQRAPVGLGHWAMVWLQAGCPLCAQISFWTGCHFGATGPPDNYVFFRIYLIIPQYFLVIVELYILGPANQP